MAQVREFALPGGSLRASVSFGGVPLAVAAQGWLVVAGGEGGSLRAWAWGPHRNPRALASERLAPGEPLVALALAGPRLLVASGNSLRLLALAPELAPA